MSPETLPQITNKLVPLAVTQQISQLFSVSAQSILAMKYEVQRVELPWREFYSDYQSSGWETVSLLNATGVVSDGTIRDGIGIATEALKQLPSIEKFLKDLNLKYMWVRLARLAPNSFLWEHRDYAELNDEPRLRLHLPLITNPWSQMVFPEVKVHMAVGSIWKLDPKGPHGVCNRGYSERIHLLMDCYMDPKLKMLIQNEYLETDLMLSKDSGDYKIIYQRASRMAKLGFFSAAESLLLKSFFEVRSPSGQSYDLIVRMYQEIGLSDRAHLWREKRKRFLATGVRG